MDKNEFKIRKRLHDDLKHYALKCLKIRTKSGSIEPFTFNKAQEYIHEQLEKQLRETGRVRALILKGRQQGCCLSPDSKVLTSDYRWIKLDDIQVGERIVACDEEGVGLTSLGRKHSRKLRTAIVEHKAEFVKETIKISLDNGAQLILTLDHRMLSKQRGGDRQVWRNASDLKVGDDIRALTRPPSYEPTFEDGWIGGIIDGEGSWRGGSGAKRLSLHQVDGPVLQRIKKYFEDIAMPYCEVIDSRGAEQSNKLGSKHVHRIDIHRAPYLFELLSRCRPTRFVNKDWHTGHELPGKAAQSGIKPWAEIISIETTGRRRVIDLQTSEKTFIVEGLVSHNSTYVGARFYHKTTYARGCQSFILCHALDATSNLFKMAKRFFENTPAAVRPQVSTSNSKELIFGELDSGYKLGTAENKNVGRSSTIQLLHGSEVAFWANAADHAVGVMQAIPNSGKTEVIMESTANGVGNYFHQQWQLAESKQSEFIAIFVPWFWQDEYTKDVPEDFQVDASEQALIDQYGISWEQIHWRRMKVTELSVNGMDGTKAFMQEYPCNSTEAFQLTGEDSFIASDIVMRARKHKAEKYGPLLLGVDPARFGDDRTSIIRRQGRVAYGLESHTKKDTMEIVGIVKTIIDSERPDKVFVDVGGLGAGVVDRLRELVGRDIIVAVNAGNVPIDARKYLNKRAEMWALCKEWLNDEGGAQIPDSDSLHADLCGIRYKVDSNSRLVMEQKAEMKKRGVRSPDESDSLCLTFAMPESAYENKRSKVLDKLADSFNKHLAAKDYLR